MGPLDKSKPWNTKGLQGSYRFIQKVWKVCIENKEKINNRNESSDETIRIFHQTIKKVTEDLEKLSFNTAVSQMMIFINHILTLKSYDEGVIRSFLIILNPFAPHISEEINQILFSSKYKPISSQNWPKFDKSYINMENITIAVQVNGKTKSTIQIKADSNEELVFKIISKSGVIDKFLLGKKITRKIYIPNKIFNLVIN